jgi:hypothetical protein
MSFAAAKGHWSARKMPATKELLFSPGVDPSGFTPLLLPLESRIARSSLSIILRHCTNEASEE